jgi:hypothetical protein
MSLIIAALFLLAALELLNMAAIGILNLRLKAVEERFKARQCPKCSRWFYQNPPTGVREHGC